MFNLENAIAQWKAPFVLSRYYSSETIAELESHLLDTYREFAVEGIEREDAFEAALQRIGSEKVLRVEHKKEWKSTSLLARIFSTYRAERKWISSDVKRWWYGVARLGSLGLGLWWLPAILVSSVTLITSPRNYLLDWDQWYYLQGSPLWILLGFSSLFNLIPFKEWSRSWSDILRVIHTALVVGTVAFNVRIAFWVVIVSNGGEAFMWEVWLCLGPFLWLVQVFGKRNVVDSDYVSIQPGALEMA